MTASAQPIADPQADALPPGVVLVDGARYMKDAKGVLTPIEVVREQSKLEDQTVRRLFAAALELNTAMVAFKAAAFDDLDSFAELLASAYKTSLGGAKGNVTLSTFDGLYQIRVQVADRIDFGSELQVARKIVNECLTGWSKDAHPALRAIVSRAFQDTRDGKVNRGALLELLRYDIDDETWKEAMRAIRDSIRVVGSARYIRFYRRTKGVDSYYPLSLDMATV
jgi:hypothetical protein